MTDEIVDRLDTLPQRLRPGHHHHRRGEQGGDRGGAGSAAAATPTSGSWRATAAATSRRSSSTAATCSRAATTTSWSRCTRRSSPQDTPNDRRAVQAAHVREPAVLARLRRATCCACSSSTPRSGMVFPPVYHIAYPTLGHAWFLNKERAEQEARPAGDPVPFDDTTPLSAYGSFFIARPEALRAITSAGFTPRGLPRRVGLRRRRAHPRARAAGQLCGAEHRPPLPRGDERRARGDQLLASWSTARSPSARAARATRAQQIKRISKLKRIRRRLRELDGAGRGCFASRGGAAARHDSRWRRRPRDAGAVDGPIGRIEVRRGPSRRDRRPAAVPHRRQRASAAAPTASASSAGCWRSR